MKVFVQILTANVGGCPLNGLAAWMGVIYKLQENGSTNFFFLFIILSKLWLFTKNKGATLDRRSSQIFSSQMWLHECWSTYSYLVELQCIQVSMFHSPKSFHQITKLSDPSKLTHFQSVFLQKYALKRNILVKIHAEIRQLIWIAPTGLNLSL